MKIGCNFPELLCSVLRVPAAGDEICQPYPQLLRCLYCYAYTLPKDSFPIYEHHYAVNPREDYRTPIQKEHQSIDKKPSSRGQVNNRVGPHHRPSPVRLDRWAILLYGIHAGPRRELLVLVPQLADLQERVHPVALQTVQGQTAGPVLGVHTAER